MCALDRKGCEGMSTEDLYRIGGRQQKKANESPFAADKSTKILSRKNFKNQIPSVGDRRRRLDR